MKEFEKFDSAMDVLLRADPKAVKDAMEKESREQAKERAAKGERKRGRKPQAKRRASTNEHYLRLDHASEVVNSALRASLDCLNASPSGATQIELAPESPEKKEPL